MRAAVFHETGKPLTIESVADPVPLPGELVLDVSHCGICGSDLHLTDLPGALPSGLILGHEFAGTVVDANGTGIAAGTRVTALPVFPCWDCEECAGGHIFHCARVMNVGWSRPGAFARSIAVQARLVKLLPAGIDFRLGALIEPLAVGCRIVSFARDLRRSNVLVLGAGPIGAAATLFAILNGARRVVVSEPGAGRRAKALEHGASAVIDPAQEDVGARFAALCGGPPDIVIECVGLAGAFTEAVKLVRHRGQVISAGGSFQPEPFVAAEALLREVTLNFSCAYEETDFEAAMDAVARGLIAPQPLITDVIALDALPATFEALRKPTTQCKVLVQID